VSPWVAALQNCAISGIIGGNNAKFEGNMENDKSQLDTDGYYGDEDVDEDELDLSFLDEDEKKK
jgi:hypothetical protein